MSVQKVLKRSKKILVVVCMLIVLTSLVEGCFGSSNPLKDAKTFTDIKSYFSDIYNITVSDDLWKLYFPAIKDVCLGIDAVLREYPEAAKTFQAIKPISKEEKQKSYYSYVCVSSSGKKAEIYLSTYWFANADRVKEIEDGCKKNGKRFVGYGAMAIGAHETAHAVELYAAQKEYKDNVKKHFSNGDVANKLLADVKNEDIEKQLGKYATKSKSDCLAEGIADHVVNGNNAQKISKNCFKLLHEIIKKK